MHNITVRQIKAARALLDWSQAELARRSGISEPSVKRIEAVDGRIATRTRTAEAICAALAAAGIEFIRDDRGTGVRVRQRESVDEGLRPEQLDASNDG